MDFGCLKKGYYMMKSKQTFHLKDGRIITVDFLDIKSLKAHHADMAEISDILQEMIDAIESGDVMRRTERHLNEKLGLDFYSSKVLAGLDVDGHFHTIKLSERNKVWHFLTKVLEDGDAWANLKDDYLAKREMDYHNLPNAEWEDLVLQFTQRGMCEITTL